MKKINKFFLTGKKETIRLNRYITKSGYCSRRKAEVLIKEGKVKVNSRVVREPWWRVNLEDSVIVEGKKIKLSEHIYIILNKPRGFVTTRRDKFAKKTIYQLLPERVRTLFPVGRLDKDSRGLILLTNDGDFCYKLTHPKFEVEKEYLVTVEGRITKDKIKQAYKGIIDRWDLLKVKKLSIEKISSGRTRLKVVVNEGKKRHLRRLFSSLGYEVVDLQRVRIGNFLLGRLKEGSFKEIRSKKYEGKH